MLEQGAGATGRVNRLLMRICFSAELSSAVSGGDTNIMKYDKKSAFIEHLYPKRSTIEVCLVLWVCLECSTTLLTVNNRTHLLIHLTCILPIRHFVFSSFSHVKIIRNITYSEWGGSPELVE